jgi:hypothetical protein
MRDCTIKDGNDVGNRSKGGLLTPGYDDTNGGKRPTRYAKSREVASVLVVGNSKEET